MSLIEIRNLKKEYRDATPLSGRSTVAVCLVGRRLC